MRKILTGDATKAAGYIGPARSLLAQCKRLGLPVMNRFGKDVRIEVRVNPWGDQVWVHATGGGEIELVFASAGELLGYSYTQNRFPFDSTTSTDAALQQLFPERVATNSGGRRFATSAGFPEESGTTYSATGFLPGFAGSLGLSGATLSFIDKSGGRTIATMPGKDVRSIVPQSAFAMLEIQEDKLWNRLNGPYVWQVPPLNPSGAIGKWHWQPRIWYPDKGNYLYAAGMWYGTVGYRTYGPAEEIHVQYGGLLDDRDGRGDNFGYCEVFRKAIQQRYPGTGEPPEDVDFLEAWFTLDFKDVGRASFADANEWGIRFVHNSVWMNQPMPAFTIDYLSEFGPLTENEVLDVAFWSAPLPEQDEDFTSIPLNNVGIVAVSPGNQFAVHLHRRYVSYTSVGGTTYEVLTGSDYKGHSTSTSGRYLAVFFGNRIFVYDLVKKEALRDTEYDSLATYQDVVVVPTRPKDLIGTVPESAGTITDMSQTDMAPAIGGLISYWEPSNQGTGTSGWKVMCEDGVYAVGKIWGDGCWEWTATRIQPRDSDALDRPHAVSIEGKKYEAGSFFGLVGSLPYYLGQFSGPGALFTEILLAKWDKDGKPFHVEASAGLNTKVELIERGPIGVDYGFGISSGGVDYYTPYENAVAPYEWSAEEGYLIDREYYYSGDWEPGQQFNEIYEDSYRVLFIPKTPVCEDTIGKVIVRDSCGRVGERKVEIPGPDPLYVRQNFSAFGGDLYRGGGVKPYTIRPSCGSYDPETNEIDTEGCCGTGTVRITDDCGANADAEYRYPSGQWVFDSCEGANGFECGDHLNCWVTRTVISGGTKYVYVYYETTASLGGSCPDECEGDTLPVSDLDGDVDSHVDSGFTGSCCGCLLLAYTNRFTWECA